MTGPGHTPPPPPTSVIARCAADCCHGATTSGLRLPEGSEYGDQVSESLAELSDSMRLARLRWEAREASAR